jgi:tetratricopeptide (TPR) repeat protein
MFSRAIEIDPAYGLAYSGLADCCSFLCMYSVGSDADREQAEVASRKALELSPEIAETHASLGLALSLGQRHSEAEKAFETAIRLGPRLFEAYFFYARNCRFQGKHEQAAELFAKAAEVRPEDYQALALLAGTFEMLNRKAESKAAYRDALERARKHMEFNPDDARALYLGANALVYLGELKQALGWAQRALSMDPDDAHTLYNVACVYSLAGKVDEGLQYLERSVDAGFPFKNWIETDSDFDSIRHHPRYQALMKQLD